MDAFWKKIFFYGILLTAMEKTVNEHLQMFPNLDKIYLRKDVNQQIIGLLQQQLHSLKFSVEHYYPKKEDP